MIMTRSAFLILIVLVGQLSCTQERVESRTALNKYSTGQIMREQVKYEGNDTIVEFLYFQDGQLNRKGQLLNDQRTGWAYTYNRKGELLFQESYRDGELSGEFKAFYTTGQISRVDHYRENSNVDTTRSYDRNGEVTKEVAYLTPCDFGSCGCDQFVVVYENGTKVYSYELRNGSEFGNQTVYDQADHLSLMARDQHTPLYEEGRSIFRSDCGMCHKRGKQPAGVSLNSFSRTMNEDELIETVAGRVGHPAIQLSEKQAEALMEYINDHCP